MTPTKAAALNEQTLVAELLGEALREAQGQPGVLVRDRAPPRCARRSRELAKLIGQDIDLRIAYLESGRCTSAASAGIPDDVFTHSGRGRRDVAQHSRPATRSSSSSPRQMPRS